MLGKLETECMPEVEPALLAMADLERVHGAFQTPSVEWSQLERGPYRGDLCFIEFGTIRVFREGFNLGVRRHGTLGLGTSMVALLEDRNTCARWFGTDVTEHDVALTASEICLNSMGSGALYWVMFDARGLPAGRDVRLARNDRNVAHLRAYMRRIFFLAKRFPSALGRPAMRGIVEGELLRLLASTREGHDVEVRPSHNRRINAVRAAETYMLDHIDEPISLQQLSVISGLTPGSLRNAFEAVVGITPIAYLKRRRLSGVRRALVSANRHRTRIIDVALDWGFTHMGHFAADYQEMFAERPSQTLARP
jgi:AraC-like DNA-binding protein